jgi:hypothetical protein
MCVRKEQKCAEQQHQYGIQTGYSLNGARYPSDPHTGQRKKPKHPRLPSMPQGGNRKCQRSRPPIRYIHLVVQKVLCAPIPHSQHSMWIICKQFPAQPFAGYSDVCGSCGDQHHFRQCPIRVIQVYAPSKGTQTYVCNSLK